MIAGIRVRRLSLHGLSRDYGPSFLLPGADYGLAIVAGQIMTGKSSVLEFVDFCLGSSEHPTHPEIAGASIRTALLELEIDGELCVIERSTFPAEPFATIHWAGIDGLDQEHAKERRPLKPAGAPDSLSTFLLESIGLAGLRLKEAPTQAASGSDPLSYRDLVGLTFVSNERLGSKTLLYENDHMKALKLRQVIDAVFGVHEQDLVDLSTELDKRRRQHEAAQVAAATLRGFLTSRDLPDESWLTLRQERISTEESDVATVIRQVDDTLRAQTGEVASLRRHHVAALHARQAAAMQLRDRETLLDRLQALRGQYAADVTRLAFAAEAERLFNTLNVTTCPACMQPLEATPALDDGICTLCHQAVLTTLAEGPDVGSELKSTRSRLDELTRHLSVVAAEIEVAREALASAELIEEQARTAVDSAVAPVVAPFLSQRDALVARREGLVGERETIQRTLQMYSGVGQREQERDRLKREVDALEERIKAISSSRPSKSVLLDDLSTRFEFILSEFGFPKLADARLDASYVPFIRGRRYTELSSGGRTLAAVAWQWAILELAIERAAAHPGYVIVDGIQKNLTPLGERPDPEFGRDEIVNRVYQHVLGWLATTGKGAQVLIVDNRPPTIAEESIVAYYSGSAKQPPYGLIEDAVT